MIDAFVSGLFDLANGALNNHYNKEMVDRQNKFQLKMWNLNNDYNSPKSVMGRLEEAGLNPNLVYGNGGASYQATMPTAAKQAPSNFRSSFNPLTFQQQENMQAQEELTNQNLDNAREQNRILRANARVAEKDAEIYEKTGVRPGDSAEKTVVRQLSDYLTNFANEVKRENFFDVMKGWYDYEQKKRNGY